MLAKLIRPDRRQLLAGIAGVASYAPFAKTMADTVKPVLVRLSGGGQGSAWSRPSGGLPQSLTCQMLDISEAHGHRALLVWHKGELLFESYGREDKIDTPMAGFSMGKTVLSLMYGAAWDRGVIPCLDETVELHINEWRSDPRGKLTPRQLLQMRSGLKLYSLARGEPEAMAMASGINATETALATPLAGLPDQNFVYANVNSQIAGLYLSRAIMAETGLTYAEALQAWLLEPLGVGDIFVEYERSGGHQRYFAGIHTTARDWLSLALGVARPVEQGGVVSQGWLDQMTAPSAHPQYGLHVWCGAAWQANRHYGDPSGMTVPTLEPYVAQDMLVLDGAGGQRAYVAPTRQMVIVRMGHPSWTWEDSALPNLVTNYLDRL